VRILMKHAAASMLALLTGMSVAVAASPEQQASLRSVLTSVTSEAVSAQRLTCFFGEEPERVAKARRAGQTFLPDAADICVAVLVRSARDGKLFDLYRTILREQGGDLALVEQMPMLTGTAALKDADKMTLGNGKAMDVPPTLAFDAGFTVAYLRRDGSKANADPVKLRAVIESCLTVKTDAGTCFAAGYAEGGKALTADPMTLFSQ
jgi:hypothetical protein